MVAWHDILGWWESEHFQNCNAGKEKDGKNKVVETLTQYSQSSSLHGIQYVFEGGKNLFMSRVLWIVIVLAAATIGILLSIQVRYYVICLSY